VLKKLLKQGIDKIGLSGLIFPRVRLANKYLRGFGVEVGALAFPLRLSKKASATYIDIATREESIRKFPELDPNDIVQVDFISDGFTLTGVPSDQFDFLIANHVLEHSPNPIGALVQWCRVIKPGGILYFTVPHVDKCFDRGRHVTTFQHMFEDFQAEANGQLATLRERNKVHYREWLTFSESAILKRPAITGVHLEKRIKQMAESDEEIHFHTFTLASVHDLLSNVRCEVLPELQTLEVHAVANEIIVILKIINNSTAT
jgi:SAM-dependent methyltransferase